MKTIKHVPRTGRFWAWSFVVWLILLTVMSHSQSDAPLRPPLNIPYFDKVAHFGYFFGGSGLLSAALFYGKSLPWKKILFIVTLSMALIGVYDEYHQSFFENRSGNDPWDWLADTLGAFTGALVFKWTELNILRKHLPRT